MFCLMRNRSLYPSPPAMQKGEQAVPIAGLGIFRWTVELQISRLFFPTALPAEFPSRVAALMRLMPSFRYASMPQCSRRCSRHLSTRRALPASIVFAHLFPPRRPKGSNSPPPSISEFRAPLSPARSFPPLEYLFRKAAAREVRNPDKPP